MVKRIHKLTRKATRSPRFTDTYPEDSNKEHKEKEHVAKKASKSLGDVETIPEELADSDTEETARAMGFPIEKFLELGKNEEGIVFKK